MRRSATTLITDAADRWRSHFMFFFLSDLNHLGGNMDATEASEKFHGV